MICVAWIEMGILQKDWSEESERECHVQASLDLLLNVMDQT
jgi:hypothetical protein